MAKDKKKVRAGTSDTLCNIAVKNGFLDCTELRKEPANAYLKQQDWVLKPGDEVTIPDVDAKEEPAPTEEITKFVKPGEPIVAIRFVHGSKNLVFADDRTLTVLNVSNYRTDKAGKDRQQNFVNETHYTYDEHADADPDTFKVEVFDARTNADFLDVELEALKPEYNSKGRVYKWVEFTSPERDERRLTALRCKRMTFMRAGKLKKTNRFRSCYLRLVTDKTDRDARKKQTLLVTDMVEEGSEKIEILDQKVRAAYTLDDCPGVDGPKCSVRAEADVGEDKLRAKIRLNIVRKSHNGDGEVTSVDARRRFLKYIREFYAQANMSLTLVDLPPVRLVNPPANMFAIANETGDRATGNRTIKVKIKIDDKPEKSVQITTKADDKPIETASKLAEAIRKEFKTIQVIATENPPLVGKALGSADILVGDPLTQKIKLDIVTNGDPKHKVDIGQVVPGGSIQDFGGADGHVGTLGERVLVKNYDTGSNRLDCYIVHDLASAYGEAFTPNRREKADRRPIAAVTNTFICTVDATTKPNFRLRTVPHEIGHALMDLVHAHEDVSLMRKGGINGVNYSQELDACKRIHDPAEKARYIEYDDKTTELKFENGHLVKHEVNMKVNEVRMIRQANTDVIAAWDVGLFST